jgi:GT2 family glycosyltransferase
MSSVSVIIPNWNGAERLEKLFASLRGQTANVIEEVIVVDNGSTDASRDVAHQAGARVIALLGNQGFAAAVNRGILEARYPWLAILNNDVELAPDWLQNLVSAAEAKSAWFATGKLLDAADHSRIDGTFDAVCRGGTAWRCGSGRLDGPEFANESTVYFAPFTALLARKELFERAGMLDQQFESYLEDVEFGLRCAQRSFAGIYVPNAVGYHTGSATLGPWHPATVRRISRNQLLIVAKHYPHWWFLRHGWHVLVGQGLWGLLAIRHLAGFAWFRGKIEGLVVLVRSDGSDGMDISPILAASERQILDLQRKTGYDWYWRMYFLLTFGIFRW